MTTPTKSLSELGVGDKVLLDDGSYSVATIERVLQKQLVVRGVKYNRQHGHRPNFHRECIFVFDQAEWDEIEKDLRLRRATNQAITTDWRTLSKEKLFRIVAILNEP